MYTHTHIYVFCLYFVKQVAAQKAASGPDDKDTADFKYITFTEMPPFHAGHK